MKRRIILAISLSALLLMARGPLQARTIMKKDTTFRQIFPQGEKLPEQFSRYFIGQAYLAPLVQNNALNVPVSNVTFEPGCRNNWHSHTGGQLLLCTAGRGFYQEKGQPARELLPGDVVEIAAGTVHWHGAAPESWFSHLAIECNPQTNVNTWLGPVDDQQYAQATARPVPAVWLTENALRNRDAWFPGALSELERTDPELAEVFGNFAFDETMRYGDLDMRTRVLVTMASAIAQGAAGQYATLLEVAWNNGIEPAVMQEVLYHAVPYAGMATVGELIGTLNTFLASHGVELPLEPRSATTPEDRLERGLALQKAIFGQQIDRMYETAPANQVHIQRYLSANCFGDYQTRSGLDVRQRELLTFAILISMGGCEPQVKGHIRGNVQVGNGKDTLLAVVTQLLPYIGYPRALNALNCLNETIPEE